MTIITVMMMTIMAINEDRREIFDLKCKSEGQIWTIQLKENHFRSLITYDTIWFHCSHALAKEKCLHNFAYFTETMFLHIFTSVKYCVSIPHP